MRRGPTAPACAFCRCQGFASTAWALCPALCVASHSEVSAHRHELRCAGPANAVAQRGIHAASWEDQLVQVRSLRNLTESERAAADWTSCHPERVPQALLLHGRHAVAPTNRLTVVLNAEWLSEKGSDPLADQFW